MLPRAENALLTRTGPGTPMGETMRRLRCIRRGAPQWR